MIRIVVIVVVIVILIFIGASIISSVYVSSTAIAVYFYPSLFFPLTVSYISGVGVHELWDRFERRTVK